MKRKDLDDERSSKKQIGSNDYKLLSKNGNLGLYEECELTHIYLIENKTKFYHYFALLTFEEFSEVDDNLKERYLTNSLVKINQNFKLGIFRIRVSLKDSKDIFDQLCNGQLYLNDVDFVLPEDLQLLPKSHVPTLWGYNGVMINKILKPNIWGDRYILEFISIKNNMNDFFSAAELGKINSEIKKFVPIDLASVYDRIGSFIFQFPITLISAHSGISKDWCHANLSLELHPEFLSKDDLCSTVITELDDVTTGFHSFDGAFKDVELNVGDSNNFQFTVFNKKNGLIYKSTMGNFIRDFGFNMGIGMQNSEPRIFTDSDGNKQEVSLVSYSLGGRTGKSQYYDTRTKKRISQNEIISKSGRFLNVKEGERVEALNFLHSKINEKTASCSEVWLWDPFLRQADIFDTLYFIGCSDIIMKCITSYKNKKRQEGDAESFFVFKQNEKDKFLNNSENHLGINLELRAVHDNYGFDFHDRFLFIIPKDADEIPTVYSLGTSVNGIGKSHHLIQQTLDPRNVIETFKELWGLLSDEESIIIKLPENIK